ncbi:SDR family NAD(P)-dependent oxidoreductase [Ectobacillus ponti]|uniref:SDR family NAD(P)-dependent oxidoreductase n=1 Tax=Ectobacillus ponti TaxID=2961894 RepID=A0AA42BNI5_9BACI|nr:SDR family NAD(P)-dependent oxidoreductase [Ectobacillus ponti]MCP8967692.1 SDR family NAD(P)-dependent oxidoreductase [Ectobacillus ponti]
MRFLAGQELPTSFSITVTPDMVQQYAHASGDHSSIHLDDAAARDAGFSGAIAHGMLSMGLCTRLLAPLQGGTLLQFDARFLSPLLVGQTLHISGRTESVDGRIVNVVFRGASKEADILHGSFVLETSPLHGQTAIITGSTRGIGKSMALRLAREGAAVIINGRTQEGVDAVVADIQALGGQAAGVAGSVADMETGERLLQAALTHFGRADYLINNAGITRDRMAHKIAELEWDEVLNVHLKGAFSCSKPFLRQARTSGGTIINVVSSAGWEGVPGQLNYSAAKAGLLGMTMTLAKEGARSGIRVYAVAPAALTDMTRPLIERAQADAAAGNRELDSYWQVGSAEEVAAFVRQLLVEGTLAESGSIYAVNGKKAERLTLTMQREALTSKGD